MGVRLNPEGDVEIDSKKLYWPKNMLLMKYLQFHTYFAEILVISLTIGELILTKGMLGLENSGLKLWIFYF